MEDDQKQAAADSTTPEESTAKVDKRRIPKADRAPPTTGQSAPSYDLPYDKMNTMEKFTALAVHSADQNPVPIAYLSERFLEKDPEEWTARAKLLVRNSLRRLVSGGWVTKGAPGMYSPTTKCTEFFEGNYHLAGTESADDS